jgi:thymidylate kinase
MSITIAICGADRVGKATQSQLLVQYFRSKGMRVQRVEIPFNDNATHTLIYKLLKNGLAKRLPMMFQSIHFLNKYFFQSYVLPILENDNDVIIFDRWKLSSTIYGMATGLSKWFIDATSKPLLNPDLTIVLTTSARVEEKRDDYEKDVDLQTRVRQLYVEAAEKDVTNKIISIDASGSIEAVHTKICSVIRDKLNITKKSL